MGIIQPNHALFPGVVLLLLTAASCERSLPDPSADAGDSGGETTLADVAVTIDNPYPVPAPSACSPTEIVTHTQSLIDGINNLQNGRYLGPWAPKDPTCRPIIDQTCETLCDCVVTKVAWQFVAINALQPWTGGDVWGYALSDGKCVGKVGHGMGKPPPKEPKVACLAGTCTVTGVMTIGKGPLSSDQPPPFTSGTGPLVCDAGDKAHWSAQLYDRLIKGRRAVNPDDLGLFDADCKPQMKRGCSTACDCKLVIADCRVHAASLSETHSYWAKREDGRATCDRVVNCLSLPHKPGTCKPLIDCVDGTCVATDAPGSNGCAANK